MYSNNNTTAKSKMYKSNIIYGFEFIIGDYVTDENIFMKYYVRQTIFY